MIRRKVAIDILSVRELLLHAYRASGDINLLITARYLMFTVERFQSICSIGTNT